MTQSTVRRLYHSLIKEHFANNRQMLFLMGPRQVGKTTLCLALGQSGKGGFTYLNWDNIDHREIILAGPSAIAAAVDMSKARKSAPILVLDEIHKFRGWKGLLKGFFDTYSHSGEIQVVVTGSARLDVFKAGSDSLMGRYFLYRIHPFSCGELISSKPFSGPIRPPQKMNEEMFEALLRYGGFPEPFLKSDDNFYRNWSQLRLQQLFQEDVRDLTRIQEVKQMELLGVILAQQAGALLNYSTIAKKVRVSHETVRRWVSTLSLLYHSFSIQPWSKNVARSLLKEPKVYLWDWSSVKDEGARMENFIASHLLKACHYWTDSGDGVHELYFLRDKQKREVDFLVAKDGNPWFLVEVKKKGRSMSPHLEYFQIATGAKHAFQVSIQAPYEEVDCFSYKKPVKVPAQTFLTQII